MKKVLGFIIVIGLVVLFGGTAVFLYRKSQEVPIVYETTTPLITDIVKKTVATGTVIPRKEVELKAQVSGVLETLYVEAGDLVKKGDIIAKVELIPDVQLLNNARSTLERAEINFRNAEVELERQRKLYQEKLIPSFEFDQVLLDYDLKKEAVVAAKSNIALLEEGASGRVSQASNIVVATVDGMVVDIPVKEGAFVTETNTFNNGTTISSVANMTDMIFEGSVDESEVGKLRLGMPLLLAVAAIDNSRFSATLEYISPKGFTDQGTIKFQIRAAVSLDEGQFLRAGYSANADIVLDSKDQVLAVNEANIIIEGDKVFVEAVIADQQFEKREISTGISDGIHIEVLSGLTLDEKIKKL